MVWDSLELEKFAEFFISVYVFSIWDLRRSAAYWQSSANTFSNIRLFSANRC